MSLAHALLILSPIAVYLAAMEAAHRVRTHRRAQRPGRYVRRTPEPQRVWLGRFEPADNETTGDAA